MAKSKGELFLEGFLSSALQQSQREEQIKFIERRRKQGLEDFVRKQAIQEAALEKRQEREFEFRTQQRQQEIQIRGQRLTADAIAKTRRANDKARSDGLFNFAGVTGKVLNLSGPALRRLNRTFDFPEDTPANEVVGILGDTISTSTNPNLISENIESIVSENIVWQRDFSTALKKANAAIDENFSVGTMTHDKFSNEITSASESGDIDELNKIGSRAKRIKTETKEDIADIKIQNSEMKIAISTLRESKKSELKNKDSIQRQAWEIQIEQFISNEFGGEIVDAEIDFSTGQPIVISATIKKDGKDTPVPGRSLNNIKFRNRVLKIQKDSFVLGSRRNRINSTQKSNIRQAISNRFDNQIKDAEDQKRIVENKLLDKELLLQNEPSAESVQATNTWIQSGLTDEQIERIDIKALEGGDFTQFKKWEKIKNSNAVKGWIDELKKRKAFLRGNR